MAAPKVQDGKRYSLVLRHGEYTRENAPEGSKAGDPVERPLEGEVRVFDQDGETRYEVIVEPDVDQPCGACNGTGVIKAAGHRVGFLPDAVLEATAV